MDYDFKAIESKWQAKWAAEKQYKVVEDKSRPKFFVLDMFPYPSGAGLHVGHPLGYIASDIFARYKRLKGFNVLHPMGYDAFGLPAEQYAIQTGQHPEKTTNDNVARYRQQLDRIGFSYDWDREVRTCDPEFYKWTQWAFLKMFDSWYDPEQDKARPISELIARFETTGWEDVSPEQWKAASEKEKSDILMRYRIAYQGETSVNWCEGLGTVLANDEVKDGLSVRGGFPVEQKKMTQWQLRVSAYAARLLDSLDRLDWSDSLKEMQRNWIGRSEGTEMVFDTVCGDRHMPVTIFTTRADTVFGVTFMVLAPESELVQQLTTEDRKEEVEAYVAAVRKKTERERISETKSVTGVFSGSYGINPLTGEQVPIWISEYVLAGYGTGAIMAVPAHDSRDYAFAKKFNLPIIPLIEGCDVSEQSFDAKDGIMCNSGFLNGMKVKDAIEAAKDYVEAHGLGRRKTNYRLRDAIFSRQRYWGEPFPVYYKDGIPTPFPESELPLRLPEISSYKPSKDGEPPLARAKDWTYNGYPLEKSTMPGFAGSSAYYLRYMDPHNDKALVSREANEYWRSVDLYVGGTEHATGHLIYSRFWNKFLYDLGYVCEDEPFRKLVNQGMIQGRSNFVYRIVGTNKFVSCGLKSQYDTTEIHVDINLVHNDKLDIEAFKKWRPEFEDAEFVLENGEYICGWAVEKMSKSMYNVVNPDDICNSYGADTLRLYEMFLGPVEQSKPWDTKGIDGVNRFLKKFWRLFYDREKWLVNDEKASPAELKVLHKLIAKEQEDIENFSYNTTISAFMIAVNELGALKCSKKEILEPMVVLLSPFAPHMAEELWQNLGHDSSVTEASFPEYVAAYAAEDNVTYPVQFNGKMRFTVELPKSASPAEVEAAVRSMEQTAKWSEGKNIVKVIVVPGRIINIVLK
ncbi:MAG: leucine--tRNA ligase [Candidatus Cryptobacteroides sp.]|nr:leucine--tRNA ligase [Rikenellaceae bacterium]MDY5746426.1 leucine--tRNA ligase [Candidatus Cryptobacteroides sp.]